jgi:hypothetical protein
LPLAEAISGQLLNSQSFLEETPQNRPETLAKILQELDRAPTGDSWTRWGRWFLAPPDKRAASPFATGTAGDLEADKPAIRP